MRTFDGRSSGIYSRSRPTYPAELYYWLSQQVKATDVVWDSACGTGQAAIDLAAYFNRVEASDISESQIAEATPHRKVNYQVFPSEKTHYPDNYFDAICVGHALHWFHLEAFWQEVKRVMKPGGLFVCWGYNWLRVGEQEDEVIAQHVLPHLTSYWPQESRLLWDQYKDIRFPYEPIETPSFDLQCNWTMSQTMDFMRTWTASQLRIQDKGDDFLVEANQILSTVWQNPTQKKRITLPFFVKAGKIK
ncbi:Ubiquinone/menaquinone biosynthesis C-methyltransferase UbiE [Marinomonas spartinae]|uniref:Ubiquinone/menaquinone biosynthesis C-methyltransferase UbiE n=1 Tax=Marinomonas spartinae TaxID=1792290 RepID=A0A1A8TDJ9_9GAMM|nr:class I SAM-dependent methyltransferase [Marinomonas spartinae]SBS31260.1 Ubiquinone/menaquinone biosynthesis C-methyltransferase UbiE [Marinomonas spartinae]SBS32411.1 Ubiquinone/menaquinone biosynthesis C-methyltransferase UbiE [Marinomonas spartinae]